MRTHARTGSTHRVPVWRVAFAITALIAGGGLTGCGDDDPAPSRPTPTSTIAVATASPTVAVATPTATAPATGTSIAAASPTATSTVSSNRAPVLAPLANRSVPVGSDVLFAVSAEDPDGDEVTLSTGPLPADSYFLPDSGVFCVFGVDTHLGEVFEVTFFASDGELTTSTSVSITVVPEGVAGGIGGPPSITLAPVGDRIVRAGAPLAIQLVATGASPLVFKALPAKEIAPYTTIDANSGVFRFTPPASLAGRMFEVTFQACVPNGAECGTLQTHETIHIAVGDAATCPDYVPAGCEELAPGGTLPQPLAGCRVVRQAGTYVYENVNILDGGGLYFVEDPSGAIDFQVSSMLVEYGGVLQAGSAACPFGAQGGKLSIGLYGGDPSLEATVANPTPGIQCLTNPGADEPCFPTALHEGTKHYCVASDLVDAKDTCSATSPPLTDPNNFLLEHYGHLNFDPTPWGYKVLGVSYGGAIRMFGAKGTALATGDLDPADHCPVPPPSLSTLDATEMQAWAELSGSSWVRLEATGDTMVDSAARTLLTLDRVVDGWGVGDEIVVGTTDWYPSHSEQRTIRAVATVTTAGGPRTQLTVDPLLYPHETSMFDAARLEAENQATFTDPVNRKTADLRAPVGLLSRSIQIRSLGESARRIESDPGFPAVENCLDDGTGTVDPGCYFGGHVMFRQGFREVQIRGAEFRQLGQGGRMGHYPVHFHLAKSTAYTDGKAYVKDSSIWDSMNRFIVLHGSHDVTLARNVGYLSVGHGYYLEDGSEIGNLLCQNLGISARAALNEYYVAQSKAENWTGTPPAPSPASRFVPPILDGVCPGPGATQCACLNPPAAPAACTTDNLWGPTLRAGSDSYMPVMFWTMNAYNEMVGNQANGVYGFGSCYWLLGSGVSGASFSGHLFDGLANFNVAGAYQVPLLRFRGNGCSTATYGLPASAEVSPAALGEAQNTGYTAVENPYVAGRTAAQLGINFPRPAVVGNFQPIEANLGGVFNCGSTGVDDAALAGNEQACVTTIIDRFTTGFNWAERNYGSVWLRPGFYLLLNSAVTDQLFGGVTFVSAGSWVQVPPGYFSLAKNSLFAGTTQHGGSPWAQRSGPLFTISASDDPAHYAPCAKGGSITCNLESEGTGFWTGGFQPKRMINIYDGPHFADGNLFVDIGSWECDPQPCLGMSSAACEASLRARYGTNALPCGIYSSTFQPAPIPPIGQPIDPHRMIVLDAAVGWKQPNGFYYPPAFTYRGSTFYKNLPVGLPDPDPMNPLNQCYSFGPADGFMSPSQRPGDCRHYVIDRTVDYIAGSMLALNGGPGVFPAANNNLPVTPIDFSTILLDLDGSLTGSTAMIEGVSGAQPSTSLSRNSFFDAPAQTDECLSFGLQTSPYQFVTTVVAPLAASPATTDPTWVNPLLWPDPTNPSASGTPLVAIYRQWETGFDPEQCDQVCSAADPSKYGCTRAAFMMGPNIGQAPYLTMSQPPGLTGQSGALYYIDTSTGASQSTACVVAKTAQMFPAPFRANDSYVVYNLFARNDAVLRYQLHVGDHVADVAAIGGRWVRVKPHIQGGPAGNVASLQSSVGDACDPTAGTGWCAGLPTPTLETLDSGASVLTVTLDQRPLAASYVASTRPSYEQCMPRDLCYFDGTECQPCSSDPGKCIRQGDFLALDIASLSQPDATGTNPLEVVCKDWATYASGTTTETLGDLSLVDCPAGGCLGFAFTLPQGFQGNRTYEAVGAHLTQCFAEPSWLAKNSLGERLDQMSQPADPLCGAPRPAVATDFCQ
jgi:hypothetical protein